MHCLSGATAEEKGIRNLREQRRELSHDACAECPFEKSIAYPPKQKFLFFLPIGKEREQSIALGSAILPRRREEEGFLPRCGQRGKRERRKRRLRRSTGREGD